MEVEQELVVIIRLSFEEAEQLKELLREPPQEDESTREYRFRNSLHNELSGQLIE